MPPSTLATSQYRVFNAQFTDQVADLLLGQPTSAIGGVGNNSGSLNMVWNFESTNGYDQYTISSAAPSANGAYASPSQLTSGAALQGSPIMTNWTLQFATSNQFQILAPNSSDPCASSVQLVWSLATGDDGAPITLAPIAQGDSTQIWTLVSEPQEGVNVAKRINDLD